MNRHVLLDRFFLVTTRIFGTPFFSASIQSDSFEQHLQAVKIRPVEFDRSGYYDADVETRGGRLPLRLHLLHAGDPSLPLVIYNMGGGEAPFDRGALRMFPLEQPFGLNVIAVEAPLQRSVKQLSTAFASLDTYVGMLAATVAMNEHILQSPRFHGAAVTIIAGTSLGGFVANRHHLAFGTATAYVPFVAGTLHGDIFLTTIASSATARENPDCIRARLNFDEAWAQAEHANVFPVLGRFDQLNLLRAQAPSYGNMPLDIWEGGHFYNSLHPVRSREKILEVVERMRQSSGADERLRLPAAD